MTEAALHRWQGRITVLGFAVAFPLMVGAVTAVEYSLLRVLPVSHWVQYSCIRPTQSEFNSSIVNFESCLAIERPVQASWYDRIKCRRGDNSRVQVWAEHRHPQTNEPREWPFMIDRRSFEGRDCLLVGSLVLNLSYGITKTLEYTSDSAFDVVYAIEGAS